MRGLDRRALAWLGALLLFACSSNSFTAASKDGGTNKDAGGGSSGSAGTAGSAGTSGSGGTAGSGGAAGGTAGSGGAAGGTAGSGGTAGGGGAAGGAGGGGSCNPTQTDACPQTSYCRLDTLSCAPCSDLSRIRFAAPEPLDGVNQAADNQNLGDLYSPRSVGSGRLFYVVSGGLNQNAIYYTNDFGSSPGVLVSVQGAKSDASPLYFLQPESFGGASFNFVFDELSSTAAHLHLYGGTLATSDAGLPQVSGTELNGVVNDPSQDSFAVAVATGVGRLWWMMGTLGNYNLFTGNTGGQTSQQVNLTVLPGNCDANFLFDATPWATPDGSLLFFRSLEQDGQCHIQFSTATDLYYAHMDANGLAPSAATSLTDVNQSNTIDTDPSMSPDLCWLYFASNREAGHSQLRLYRAHRD